MLSFHFILHIQQFYNLQSLILDRSIVLLACLQFKEGAIQNILTLFSQIKLKKSASEMKFLQGKYFNLHWGEGRVQECMLNFCNGNVNCKSACWADSDREMAAAATFLPPKCQQIFCHCQQTWLWDRGSLACSCIKLSRVQHCNKPGWQRTICQLQAVRGGTVRRQVLLHFPFLTFNCRMSVHKDAKQIAKLDRKASLSIAGWLEYRRVTLASVL